MNFYEGKKHFRALTTQRRKRIIINVYIKLVCLIIYSINKCLWKSGENLLISCRKSWRGKTHELDELAEKRKVFILWFISFSVFWSHIKDLTLIYWVVERRIASTFWAQHEKKIWIKIPLRVSAFLSLLKLFSSALDWWLNFPLAIKPSAM